MFEDAVVVFEFLRVLLINHISIGGKKENLKGVRVAHTFSWITAWICDAVATAAKEAIAKNNCIIVDKMKMATVAIGGKKKKKKDSYRDIKWDRKQLSLYQVSLMTLSVSFSIA